MSINPPLRPGILLGAYPERDAPAPGRFEQLLDQAMGRLRALARPGPGRYQGVVRRIRSRDKALKVMDAGKLNLLKGEHGDRVEIRPGISVIRTDGHYEGHLAVVVETEASVMGPITEEELLLGFGEDKIEAANASGKSHYFSEKENREVVAAVNRVVKRYQSKDFFVTASGGRDRSAVRSSDSDRSAPEREACSTCTTAC